MEDPKGLGRWISSKEDPAPYCLRNEQGCISETTEEAADFVRS